MKILIFLLCFNFFFSFSYCQPWKQYSDSAQIFINQKDPETAIEYYRKANKILAIDSFFTDTYLKNLRNIAGYYFSLNLYSNAEPFYLEVRKITEKLNGKY